MRIGKLKKVRGGIVLKKNGEIETTEKGVRGSVVNKK
jgi:hypothetical protein